MDDDVSARELSHDKPRGDDMGPGAGAQVSLIPAIYGINCFFIYYFKKLPICQNNLLKLISFHCILSIFKIDNNMNGENY